MPDFESLESLNKELEKLQAQRQMLFERERQIAIQRLRSFIEMYAIEAQELGFGGPALKAGAQAPQAMLNGTRRYVDPASGNHWGGRGARPAWLRQALQNGAKLEDFLVDHPQRPPVPQRQPDPRLVVALGALPTRSGALYRDPQTKQTWAGRGAHPAWLRKAIASGRSKQDFLVDERAAVLLAGKRR